MIKNRYKNAKIIVFGDLNLKRNEFKNKIEKKKNINNHNHHV